MTFADNPLAEAVLIELRGIRGAADRIADAYTKMAKLAESKQGGRPAESTAEPKKRESGEPKDIHTVTGYVLHFGQVVNLATNEPKTTKKSGKPYWRLKLTNGFEAMVFSTSQATICSTAYDQQKPLIVDYTIDGKYDNIESVKLGAVAAEPPREPGEDDDESPF